MYVFDCKGCIVYESNKRLVYRKYSGCRFSRSQHILKEMKKECPCMTCLLKMKCFDACDRYEEFCESFDNTFRGKKFGVSKTQHTEL